MKTLFRLICVPVFCSILLFAGDWTELEKVVASDRDSLNYFGRSVAISGDYAIVGVPSEKEDASGANTLNSAGAAYIFVRNGSSWVFQQKVVPNDRGASDEFGYCVAISGDRAIIGAPYEDEDAAGNNTISNAGSAYIFHRSGSTWTQEQKLVTSDRASADMFAFSVSISDSTAIAGTYNEDEDANGLNTKSQAGSAYIFYYDGSWSQQQKIVPNDRAASDLFGYSVGISGDHVIVGAYSEDEDATGGTTRTNAGSAYIFNRSGSTWSQQQKIVASDRANTDYFGYSVAISGDYAIAGAYAEDHDITGANTLSGSGSAYIFNRSGSIWSQQQKIVASDRAVSDFFGRSVAISGSLVIVGTKDEDHDAAGSNELSAAGSAYIYSRSGSTWSQAQKIVPSDRATSDGFGVSVGVSGWYTIIGAPNNDTDENSANTLNNSGSVYFFADSTEVPTPICLSEFSAVNKNNGILLSWITESEINNAGFVLEKRPIDEHDWKMVANYKSVEALSGQGSTSQKHEYYYLDNQIIPGYTYVYRLGDISFDNVLTWTGSIEIEVEDIKLVDCTGFELRPAYPNPFNPETVISMHYAEGSNSVVNIYNIQGVLIDNLINGYVEAGNYDLVWNAQDKPSGVYIVKMTAGDFVASQKLVLIK